MTPLEFRDMDTLLENLMKDAGFQYIYDAEPDPGGTGRETRRSCSQVIFPDILESAVRRLNPGIPAAVRKQALEAVQHLPAGDLITVNEVFHNMLCHGIPVEYRENEQTKTGTVRLMDFDNPEADNRLAVRRLLVEEGVYKESLDMVIFINGLPLVVLALGEDYDESRLTGLSPLYNRLSTWKEKFPAVFRYNALLVISDGQRARAGSLSAPYNRFTAWRSLGPESIAPLPVNQLLFMIYGLLDHQVLTDIIRFFTLFETGKERVKKIAAYYQYYAVNEAAAATVRAVSVAGRGRCGVVRHTQGSGKSLTMLFYAAKLSALKRLRNPTIIILTDRGDLDDQLFGVFSRARAFLGQVPIQAESRLHLKKLLRRNSGGIIFTTIQKFFPGRCRGHPFLSHRGNIIVMADEAHRSQYDFIDGFARHMNDALPNASFTGFTGTPLEKGDRDTRAVFGDYIDVYDVHNAVEDGVTVPIYYEGRVRDIDTPCGGGDKNRITAVCRDLVDHFQQRRKGFPGKALVAVSSRSQCIQFYREIVRLKPGWHENGDEKGRVKAIITGTSSDPAEWQPHIRDKTRRRVIGERLKDPADPLQMAIVCDMWLTGFDAPCLHTIYLDKPLRGHILVQAAARVNRVFPDKPGGLLVDYRGIAPQLKEALAANRENGGKGKTCFEMADTVALLEETHEELNGMLQGCNYLSYFCVPKALKESVLMDIREYILGIEKGREVFMKKAAVLLKAFALSLPHPTALRLSDSVTFFRRLKHRLREPVKLKRGHGTAAVGMETAIAQMMSTAVVTDEITDVLDVGDIKKAGLSLLSDTFLDGLRRDPRPRVATEFLRRLLSDEIIVLSRRNLVRGRAFMQRLREALSDFRKNRRSPGEIIDGLSGLARELRGPGYSYQHKDLSADESAVYDALTVDEKVFDLWEEETARTVARQLVEKIRSNAVIDWPARENVHAKLRVEVKRTLRIYGFPVNNDGTPRFLDTLLKQAELLAEAYSRES